MDQAVRQSGVFGARLHRMLVSSGFLPFCFALYMVTRIAMLFVRPLEQSSDFAWYYGRAVEIASGAGYAENGVITAFWPVGWPGFLAALFAVIGPSVLAAQLANLVFSAVVFAMTAMLGAALFRDRRTGRVAVLILTLYPNQIAYVPLLSTEIFYEALLLTSIYLLMQERVVLAALSGLVFGVATLTKTQSMLIPGFVMAVVFIAQPSRASFAKIGKLAFPVYLAALLVVAPWTYRNYRAFGVFIPVSTNGGLTLLTGNNPEANGDFTPDTVLANGISHDPAQQVAMDQLSRARAIGWIMQNPAKFMLLVPKKLLRLWAPDGEAEWFYQRGFAHYDADMLLFRSVRVLNQAYYFVILMLGVASIGPLLRSRVEISPWATAGAGLCVYTSLISLVFSGQSRFHFSVMPFIAIYAAWTLTSVLTGPTGQTHARMPFRNASCSDKRVALYEAAIEPPKDSDPWQAIPSSRTSCIARVLRTLGAPGSLRG